MTWLIKQIQSPQPERESDTALTFETPAEGDGFAFQVTVKCARLAGGRKHERGVWIDSEEELVQVHDLITDVVRKVCRAHSPFQPGAAEKAVNRDVDAALAAHSSLRSRWTVRVRVNLTDEVRELQRAAQIRQRQIVADAEAVTLRVQRLQELSDVSERFLTSAEGRWIARYAVRLAQHPESAAEIVAQMLDERQQHAERLVRLVNDMSSAHQQADIFELVIASEGALRHALKQLGVDVPPLESDSLFSAPELPT